MKTLLIGLFLIPAFCFGQTYKEIRKAQKEHQSKADTTSFPSPFEFTFIDSSQLSKRELFSKVNTWIATIFKNVNLDVVKDSVSGKIVIPRIRSAYSLESQYSLTIDTRDNKYRLVFNDFQTKGMYDVMVPIQVAENEKRAYIGVNKKSYWNDQKLFLKEEAEAIFTSFKMYLVKKDDF